MVVGSRSLDPGDIHNCRKLRLLNVRSEMVPRIGMGPKKMDSIETRG
jgi:hypothetical protein